MSEISENVALNQADSFGLCFRSAEDARDFSAKSVQNSIDWLSAQDTNFAKCYIEGEIHIVCRVRSVFDLAQYDLVFCHIPSARSVQPECSGAVEVLNIGTADALPDRYDGSVFSGVNDFVERPKQIIPPSVGIERPKQRKDVRWEVFAPPSFHTVEISSGIGERKIGFLGPGFAAGNGTGVSGLVEGGSEVLGNMGGRAAQCLREFFNKLDFVDIEAGFRIVLDRTGVWCWIEEGADLPFEFINIFICASEQ